MCAVHSDILVQHMDWVIFVMVQDIFCLKGIFKVHMRESFGSCVNLGSVSYVRVTSPIVQRTDSNFYNTSEWFQGFENVLLLCFTMEVSNKDGR